MFIGKTATLIVVIQPNFTENLPSVFAHFLFFCLAPSLLEANGCKIVCKFCKRRKLG